jgi:hypothetical protein
VTAAAPSRSTFPHIKALRRQFFLFYIFAHKRTPTLSSTVSRCNTSHLEEQTTITFPSTATHSENSTTGDISLTVSDGSGLDREWFKDRFFYNDFPYGYFVDKELVKYIIRLRSPKEKKVTLWSISQLNSIRPRPTILLVSMFDDCQSTTASKTTGYRVGDEFVTNTVVAEPFVSTPGVNPFHQPWSIGDHHNTDTKFREDTRNSSDNDTSKLFLRQPRQ